MPTLNYKTFGTGDPIIIMHGLFGMLDNWQTIAKKLAEDYMVYLVDLRDHGKSEHTNEFNYPISEPGIRLFLMKNLTRNKEGGYRWKMNLKLLIKHYQDILAGINFDEEVDTPTLFIRGRNSGYILDADIESLTSHFEDAEVQTIANAGHWVHAEKPNELLEAIRSFLQ